VFEEFLATVDISLFGFSAPQLGHFRDFSFSFGQRKSSNFFPHF